MTCPKCGQKVIHFKGVFSRKLHCDKCGVLLLASEAYIRTLGVFSLVGAICLLSVLGLRGFMFALLSFPCAFLLLMICVRAVPRIVAPTLVLKNFYTLETLDLKARSKDDEETRLPK